MIWQSWGDFFAMGGYALYVWGSLLVTFGLMVAEVLLVRQRFALIRRQLGRMHGGSRARTGGKR